MTIVFIASHDQELARGLREQLQAQGIIVRSRWIDDTRFGTVHTEAESREIAQMDIDDVQWSDALVLIAGPEKYKGGKFVETGYALGAGLQVYILGRRENALLHHSTIRQTDDPWVLIQWLKGGK